MLNWLYKENSGHLNSRPNSCELMIVVIVILMIMKKDHLVLLRQLFSNNLTETKSAVSEYWSHQQKYFRYWNHQQKYCRYWNRRQKYCRIYNLNFSAVVTKSIARILKLETSYKPCCKHQGANTLRADKVVNVWQKFNAFISSIYINFFCVLHMDLSI